MLKLYHDGFTIGSLCVSIQLFREKVSLLNRYETEAINGKYYQAYETRIIFDPSLCVNIGPRNYVVGLDGLSRY